MLNCGLRPGHMHFGVRDVTDDHQPVAESIDSDWDTGKNPIRFRVSGDGYPPPEDDRQDQGQQEPRPPVRSEWSSTLLVHCLTRVYLRGRGAGLWRFALGPSIRDETTAVIQQLANPGHLSAAICAIDPRKRAQDSTEPILIQVAD